MIHLDTEHTCRKPNEEYIMVIMRSDVSRPSTRIHSGIIQTTNSTDVNRCTRLLQVSKRRLNSPATSLLYRFAEVTAVTEHVVETKKYNNKSNKLLSVGTSCGIPTGTRRLGLSGIFTVSSWIF